MGAYWVNFAPLSTFWEHKTTIFVQISQKNNPKVLKITKILAVLHKNCQPDAKKRSIQPLFHQISLQNPENCHNHSHLDKNLLTGQVYSMS